MATRLALVALTAFLLTARSDPNLPSCNERIKCEPTPWITYHIHDEDVPMVLISSFLEKNQTVDPCAFNFTSALHRCFLQQTDQLSHLILGFKCKERRQVVFQDLELLSRNENVIFQMQIHNCILSIDDLDQIGNVFDFRVLTSINTELLPSSKSDETNHTYVGLQQIVSLSVHNSNSTNRLDTLFPRPDVLRSMAEVQFHNMSIHSLPNDFPARMPHLQSLDLSANNLSSPPTFPWYEESYPLPHNLSRKNVFNNRYSTLLGISLAPNLFRRTFHLDHNSIKTLRGHSFAGRIQLLSLPGNALEDFGEDSLANVTDLQRLDLSRNKLKFLPEMVFAHVGLRGLKKLDLQMNFLESIANDTFSNLPDLIDLNLAHNKLTWLREGTFSQLLNLKTLRLDNNHLEFISPGCLPADSNNLKEIFLMNNRFKEIPSEIFMVYSIRTIDLSDCMISLNTLTENLQSIRDIDIERKIMESDHESQRFTKVLKLNRNNITHIPVNNTPKFRNFLLTYKLEVKENPIECLCDMGQFIDYINAEKRNGNLDGTEYFFDHILCNSPLEFVAKKALSLDTHDLYCPAVVQGCPPACDCFTFYKTPDAIMVNCSASFVEEFPQTLPEGTIDLRLKNNNISHLPKISLHPELKKIDLSFNQVSKIDTSFFEMLPDLRELNLNHNLLTMVPESISSLELTRVGLLENHFRCDCHMIWIKDWLHRKQGSIEEYNQLTCVHGSEDKLSPIIEVPDTDFTCPVDKEWIYHLAIALSVCLLVVLVLAVLVYRFRLDLKALLFVRFNFRFLKNKENVKQDFALGAFIVCSKGDSDWAEKNIYNVIKESKLIQSVALSFKDFLVGLSYQDNFDLFMENSAKSVMVLSEEFFQDELLVASLQKAVRISLAHRTNSIVLVALKSFNRSLVKSATVRRFLRTQKIFFAKDKLLRDKLLYCLATQKQRVQLEPEQQIGPWERRLRNVVPKTDRECCYDLYLANVNGDIAWVQENVCQRLEAKGLSVCVPARDFICGAPHDTQVVQSLQKSRYSLVVLSNRQPDHVDWCAFVLRVARQMSVNERRNFLIVLVLEGTDATKLNEEIQTYLSTHACLYQDDPHWWRKLIGSISRGTEHRIRQAVPDVINVQQVEISV